MVISSVEQRALVRSQSYKLEKSNKRVSGMEMDFKNNTWLATKSSLIVLDPEFHKLKEEKVPRGQAYNTLNMPDKFTSNITASYDKMKILWYKSNQEMVLYNAKTLEKMSIIRDVVKIGKFQKIRELT